MPIHSQHSLSLIGGGGGGGHEQVYPDRTISCAAGSRDSDGDRHSLDQWGQRGGEQ